MKFLATETKIENVNWDNTQNILKEEAKRVMELYMSDVMREIYFTEKNPAVAVLECESRGKAIKVWKVCRLSARSILAMN